MVEAVIFRLLLLISIVLSAGMTPQILYHAYKGRELNAQARDAMTMAAPDFVQGEVNEYTEIIKNDPSFQSFRALKSEEKAETAALDASAQALAARLGRPAEAIRRPTPEVKTQNYEESSWVALNIAAYSHESEAWGAARWLLAVPAMLLIFYGVRYAVTGRLRPLWPVRLEH